MTDKDIGEQDYVLFGQFLERQCGIVLGDKKHYLVRSRLTPLIRKFNCGSLADVTKRVINGGDRMLLNAVIDAMTTNETLWFRDNYPFELLKNDILATLADKRRPIRIWSAACSSGQEPYSIAMSILEYQKTKPGSFAAGVQIIGTDISADMLANAQKAEYDGLSLARGLSEQRKKAFFEPALNGSMRLIPAVRSMVSFKPINLLESYTGLGSFDIVFCRNVLIYFSATVKAKILQQIAAGLQKDGILFLGASESMSGLSTDFVMMRRPSGLYYSKKP